MRRDLRIEYRRIDVQACIDALEIVPLGARLIIKELEPTKAGLLAIPPSAQTGPGAEMQSNMGYILAVGPTAEWEVKPGDLVMYGKYAGSYVLSNKYRLMNEADLLGVCVQSRFDVKFEEEEAVNAG